ncbi:hypothetical protein D9M68_865860 [compost metagenome]
MSTEVAASVPFVRDIVDQHVLARHDQNFAQGKYNHRGRQPPKAGGAQETDFTEDKQHAADDKAVERACALDEPAGKRIPDQDSHTVDRNEVGVDFHAPGDISREIRGECR